MKSIFKIAKEGQKLSVRYSQLSWVKYTTGFDFGVNDAYKDIMEYYKNKEYYEKILNKEKDKLNATDKRRINIMKNSFEPYHLSDKLNKLNLKIQKKVNELSQVLNTYRYEFEGKEITSVELSQILRNSEDREKRKKAYMTKKQVNKPLLEKGFIDLINLRKEFAEEYGAENFVDYQLSRQELDTDIFENWDSDIKEILPRIKKERKKIAQKYLNSDKIMPWDEAYISSKLSPVLNENVDMSDYYNILNNFFKKFGFNLDNYNITYDIFPRENKSEWGYNFPIEYSSDSRILANVKNQYSEFGVLLHETGHGVHSFNVNKDEIILNNGISGIISEGIANLFGSFLTKELFYKDVLSDKKKAKRQLDKLRKWRNINRFRAIPTIFFDQNLYKRDIKNYDDIKNLYWEMNEKYLGEQPYADEPVWGFKIHHTTHPIYLHNYFMGDVTFEMLIDTFCNNENIENISEAPKKFGKFLKKEVMNLSGRYKYQQLFKKISGSKFNLDYIKEI